MKLQFVLQHSCAATTHDHPHGAETDVPHSTAVSLGLMGFFITTYSKAESKGSGCVRSLWIGKAVDCYRLQENCTVLVNSWPSYRNVGKESPPLAAQQPRRAQSSSRSRRKCEWYRRADKSLAQPTSRCILFDGENISFDASLVIYINSTNIPPIMIKIFCRYSLFPSWSG